MPASHRGIGMTSQRTRERLVGRLMEQGIRDPRVLDVMRNLPRHLFVDEALATRAYEDTALPIGNGQTISQPYTVARMSEALIENHDCQVVLEVGTGCGYQTAVLSQLVERVYSIERFASLSQKARRHLGELSVRNVQLRHGDGYQGWKEAAPFDGIIVTAAPAEIPQALLMQLAEGGRMIIPVGEQGQQTLVVITRRGDEFVQEALEVASFVPMLAGTKV